ncbi:MAG: RidA family protein [Firmicutes bacterium]|nr:RidA family protein [Bacillota bacterium]
MKKQAITWPEYEKRGIPLSPAVRCGNLLFVSGQVPLDQNEKVPEKFADQATLVFNKLKAIMERSGTTLDNVLNITVYLNSMDDWQELNRIYVQYFRKPFPARTAIQSSICRPEQPIRIEVQAVACVDD